MDIHNSVMYIQNSITAIQICIISGRFVMITVVNYIIELWMSVIALKIRLIELWISMIHTIPGSAFIKPDQRNPWIKDQIKITLLPTISHLLLPNFVSCGRACPSHMTQNLVTVGAKLWTADRFIVDP